MKREQIIQQGKEGETAFQKWLDAQELGYLRIDQDRETMSAVFKNSVKRPDYFLLLPSLGFIAIDVKNSTLKNDLFTLKINYEIERTITFEHHTRIYLWYAFKDRKCINNDRWYFISAHKACEVGVKKYNSRDRVYYFEIALKHFELINKAEDLGKLYSSRIGIFGRFSRAVEHTLRSIKL